MLALQSQVWGGAKAQPQIDIIASEAKLHRQQAQQNANANFRSEDTASKHFRTSTLKITIKSSRQFSMGTRSLTKIQTLATRYVDSESK